MEQQPPINNNKQEDLATFQAVVFKLKEEEEKKGEAIHLRECNPAELREEDRDLYEKFLSGYFTFDKTKDFKESREQRKFENDSQKLFFDYISNRLAGKFYQDQKSQFLKEKLAQENKAEEDK